MKKEYIKHLLDDRNKDLWYKLKSKYSISIEESFEPNYLINFRNNFWGKQIITIYVNSYNLCPASFSHELLHLYLKSNKINISLEFEEKIESTRELHYIFSNALKSHVGNCLEHVKILPIFLQLGYPNEKFLCDYYVYKMDDQTISYIKDSYYTCNWYNRDAVDTYIGKYFAMKACNNSTFDYSHYYLGLENIDREMYFLLDNFWNEWTNINELKNYKSILQTLIINLKKWSAEKRII